MSVIHKRLKEKEFNEAKKLLELKLNYRQVGEVLKRSTATVFNISKSSNYEDYRRQMRVQYESRHGKTLTTNGEEVATLIQSIKVSLERLEALV